MRGLSGIGSQTGIVMWILSYNDWLTSVSCDIIELKKMSRHTVEYKVWIDVNDCSY